MTASNFTCRDGNLSDTLNNLLMQKLKGLSLSLGGLGRSRQCWIMELASKMQGFVLQLKAGRLQRNEDDAVCFLFCCFSEVPFT